MANNAVTGIIVLAVVGIGGYTYMKSRDNTPVGLVTFKVLGSGEGLGIDDEEKETVKVKSTHDEEGKDCDKHPSSEQNRFLPHIQNSSEFL